MEFKPLRILATGGCGFIGSNFVNMFGDTHKIHVLDAMTYAGKIENLDPKYRNRINFTKGNICDHTCVSRLITDFSPDWIVNFAAETHVDNSIKSSEEFVRTNMDGVRNILDCIRGKDVKLLQFSTDEVYGSIDVGSHVEGDILDPRNPYSACKAGADMLIKAYTNTYGVQAVTVRPTNNFGPRQFPEKLIPLFIKKIMKNQKVPVYGDGMQVRDWLYVDDTCRAVALLLRLGHIGEVYHLAGRNEVPNIVIIKQILEILGKDESLIEYVKDRPGHDRRYSLDDTKMRMSTTWEPAGPFEFNLKKTVDWYKEEFKCMA